MPVTLYTEDDVQVYTRLLAAAYRVIREEAADPEAARAAMLKKIENTLGWMTPPPMTAPPEIAPCDDAEFGCKP